MTLRARTERKKGGTTLPPRRPRDFIIDHLESMADAIGMNLDKADFDPEAKPFIGEDLPPIVTPEQEAEIRALYENNPQLQSRQDWIQTYTCKKLYPLSPRMEDICIEDIAHSLSMLCRFTGHCKRFYSVAEHSILVSYFCDPADRRHALLHDGSEYGLTDLPTPLKRMLATESRDLMSPNHKDWHIAYDPFPIKLMCMSPEEAEAEFLKRFKELFDPDIKLFDPDIK